MKGCHMYDTKLHQMLKLQFWSSGSIGVAFLPLHPDPDWSRMLVPVKTLSMGQIYLFNHLPTIIIISYLKPYDCVQIVCIVF